MASNGVPGAIPRPFLNISPVPTYHHAQPGSRGPPFPLSLLAHIISYVEDVADIARMTRTCRLMYYMTLPVLYERVTLRSYAELRYVDGRPEGYGSGSPFAMALSGLATGSTAGLVKEFAVTGSWAEPKADEYSQGKIPDSTLFLGIVVNTAIEKMVHLRSFCWALDTKPTKPTYSGLAARSSLTSLELRFPTNRAPRPISLVPPMPNLQRLRVSDIDPLCYPDDISVLLLHAKKLEDLRIHWSPRMRQEAEPSINLRSVFGKCLEANHKIPLKHFGLQNFYGPNTGDLNRIVDTKSMTSADFIEVFGGTYSRPTTIWVDETWKNIPGPEYFQHFKRNRVSETAFHHAKILSYVSGLEELYIIGDEASRRLDISESVSPVATPSTPASTPSKAFEQESITLCKQYIHVLTTCHGPSLKRLLLSDQWAISGAQISELTSGCPNLEQFGFAPDADATDALTLLAPFLTKLRAMRMLQNEHTQALLEDPEMVGLIDGSLKSASWRVSNNSIQWVGLGDKVVKIGKRKQVPDEEGKLEWRRDVTLASRDDISDIEIWKLDALEL